MTLKLRAKRDGWWVFRDAFVGTPENFTTRGALNGQRVWQGMHRHGECFCVSKAEVGQLPEHYWDSYAHSAYAVYSYATPIAWRLDDGTWIMPGIKYSVTTSAHQSKIFTAISQIGA